jgi:hypothetical protein
MSKPEMLRRIRLGDIKRLLLDRYGPTLPDDDAGRDDLFELLLCTSLRPASATRIMRNVIEVYAPWMTEREAEAVIQQVERIPPELRRRKAEYLGERFRLINDERERLAIRTIRPCDLTDEEIKERRKARKRQRQKREAERRRRRLGQRSRTAYLASSLSSTKPWLKEGISRRTWERRRKKMTQPVTQLRRSINSYKGSDTLASPEQGASQQGRASHSSRVDNTGNEREVRRGEVRRRYGH